MAEMVGAAHDHECANATGHLCVCACRGTLHGVTHRHGHPARIQRMGQVTVMATTGAHVNDAGADLYKSAAARRRHPVTVTVVQTDSPTGGRTPAGGGNTPDVPEVTGTVGPASTLPRDLSGHSDDDLMQLFADLSEQGREDDLARVWDEMGRREEAAAAAVAPTGRYTPPKPYEQLDDDALETAFGDASTAGDEAAVRDIYAEMGRREEAANAAREEARKPPAGPATPENPFMAWADVAGSPIPGHGRATPDTQARAARALRLALGLDQDADAGELARAERDDPRPTELRYAWALAWYRKLAAADGITAGDPAYGMPDTAAGAARLEARQAEEAATRAARAAEQAAKDARAATVNAGPGAPAALRTPTYDYAVLARAVNHSYSTSPGGHQARLRLVEARRRAFDLDENASDQTILAAEKADPRSGPVKAATVIAWYRLIAKADGVPDDAPDWQRGPADNHSGPIPDGLTPANVAKAWSTWQEIRAAAKSDQDAGDGSAYDRYVMAMRHAYGLPDDATAAEITRTYNADNRTDNQIAADFIAHYRQLATAAGVDPSDRLRYGPPDRGGRNRPVQWAESTPAQVSQIENLLARGWEYLDAYAEVHHLDVDRLRQQQAGGIIDRRAGETTMQALKRAYDTHVHTQYKDAEDAVRGHMLSPAGKAAGIDPVTLFSGPTDRARKYASEDLLRWWEANGGRQTFQQFRAQITGREADKRAAAATARHATGKDFG